MSSSELATGASAEGLERPEGVIFLGESQWVLGNRPSPGGPLTTVLAVPPLCTRAGNGVVSISFDMRLLSALP
jgi:hypothetical protein